MVTVRKMLPHEKKLLVLFRASFFRPNVAFCSVSKVFVTVPTVSDLLGAVYSSDVDGKQLYENILDCKRLVSSLAF